MMHCEKLAGSRPLDVVARRTIPRTTVMEWASSLPFDGGRLDHLPPFGNLGFELHLESRGVGLRHFDRLGAEIRKALDHLLVLQCRLQSGHKLVARLPGRALRRPQAVPD